ncbi:heptaprenyl diphosphate synthase component II [Bacillus horti]|uniref:Heptaprenyl diphosphate synthase n=1 Tax=Caldalkalibacillus horti TaxID=77523 RepID=A0ABT9VWW3_9BACI|nr:heptaprenyl diphosphate synthase component II [Bacillus horti]MDQ0165468.1 heptaprenyl diphosphate synthase [Bacillus horti]
MNLLDIYKELKSDIQFIEDELSHSLDTSQAVLQESSVHLLHAGGKRIRPVFVLLGGKNGEYNLERLKHVAVALELIHMATLVHDDVIDHADTRRGQLTVKAKWDNRVAMYAGDYILAKSIEIICKLKDARIHHILAKSINEVCLGEIEQIRSLYNWDQNHRTYFLRIKRKTALLMAVCCQLGGLACDVSEKQSKALYYFGYYVGMAFQITDDILDFTGTEKQLGKPAGSDLLQGNITLPVLEAFKQGDTRQLVIKEMEQPKPDMPYVIKLIKKSGGIDQAKQVAQKYLAKARQALEALENSRSKEMFLKITQFIEKRDF